MIPQESTLVVLVKMIDLIPTPPVGPAKQGRPITYPEKLFLKALLIMIVKHLHRVHELLSVLNEPTFEIQQLRSLLTENGRYPARRTWERRSSWSRSTSGSMRRVGIGVSCSSA